MAPLHCEMHHLFGGHTRVIGDVEEVADVVEQMLFPFLHREILTHDHDTVSFAALAGPIGELGDLLTDQAGILIAPLAYDAFLDVDRPLPGWPDACVTRPPLHLLPGLFPQ